ncbi:MAG: threonine/serine dehydratase [Alphaproteobacteria bacterium]|nr:threonine/serine dehydratase [Alphaproteobacteria bacterium]
MRAAAQRLKGRVTPTPLLEWPELNERLGGRILIKPECLQQTGTFKIRGATNFIIQLTDAERANGVVAYSSGNHAQGVAAAARALGAPATIVMPADAPRIKTDNTARLGAEIVPYNRHVDDREEIAAAIAAEQGRTILPPFDHAWTIAGQGTVGLEIADQAAALGVQLDAVLIPCGGGGLTAGCALAIKATRPRTEIYFVEPEHYDDTNRSVEAGRRLANDRAAPPSSCDALLAPMPGEHTFSIIRRMTTGGLVVTEQEVATAMAAGFSIAKLVVEPGGAVALAAALAGRYDCRGKTVALVLSGGNVDIDQFAAQVRDGSSRLG